MFPVNVSPDMAMYNLLKNQGYETAYALAEFIDNAIHAWQQNKATSPLSVTIKFYSHQYKDAKKRNSIEVIDTGPGIARNQIASAFKPAKLPASKGLSEFGIGMKTAAVWFADEWALTTRPAKDTQKYHFQFNLEDLLKSGSDTVAVVESSREENKPDGTIIFLHNLRRPITKDKYEEICDDLRELYQKFSSGKDKILMLSAELDDTPRDLNFPASDKPILEAPVYKTIKSTLYAIGQKRKWVEKISFKFMGSNVHGHIQLLETGSYTNNPGLVLLRHNRVIMGTTRTPYIPDKLFGSANKYGRQRIYGELHLDDLPVSYTKDKFEIDEDEFLSSIRSNVQVAELLRQSADYRVNTTPTAIDSEADVQTGSGKQKQEQGKQKKPHSDSSDSGSKNKGQAGSNQGNANGDNQQEVNSITVLQSLGTTHLFLQDVIKETVYQYQADRPIASALCLRIVLESGLLRKIEKDFSAEYSAVSEYGIKRLVNYLLANQNKFFVKADHRVSKCVESLSKGTQLDVILINNVAHGHYHPSIDEIDKLITNMQPLLEWAYT